MGTNTGHVMTLANSIIGVSVLAMPFCFKQCGIVLATVVLLLSNIMSRLSCYYILKSATLSRRRTFEFLAFHVFGPTGKLTVELSIIGFMLGTCVAYFVVVGDLGPAIIAPALSMDNPTAIRPTVLIALALFVVLPLGLLRNIDSLSAICFVTIAFYLCLVLKVMGEAFEHLLAMDWMDKVNLWRPAGILQCLPIFSMALSCQTQLFEVFDSIPNASLYKMNSVVRSAINMCTMVYLSMGVFGYIAYCTQPFTGNVMMSFSPSLSSEVIKLGFVLSVAVSFPLVIFPCRASLHSLLFRRSHILHHELMGSGNYIPEQQFQCITVLIITVSLITGLIIPNIELVLGLVGSTIGILICVMVPAVMFVCLTSKHNNERMLAQLLFVVGMSIMILGTYANLYATEEAMSGAETSPIKPTPLPEANLDQIPFQPDKLKMEPKASVKIKDETLKELKSVKELAALPELKNDAVAVSSTSAPVILIKKIEETKKEVRQEPPIPVAPVVQIVPERSSSPEPVKQEGKKIETDVLNLKVLDINKKEVTINNEAIKKEDYEIKEVEKIIDENIKKENLENKEVKQEEKETKLDKKNELLEKYVKMEEEKQKINEEEKKILEEIKAVNKDEKVEETPIEEKSKKITQIENEVIKETKDDAQISDLKRETKLKVVKQSIPVEDVDNSIMKEKMKEGIPLPIAIQDNIKAKDGINELKPVDIGNSLKVDSVVEDKVLRREILENAEKESRAKRDIEDKQETEIEGGGDGVKDSENMNSQSELKDFKVDKAEDLQNTPTKITDKIDEPKEPTKLNKDNIVKSDKSFKDVLKDSNIDENKEQCDKKAISNEPKLVEVVPKKEQVVDKIKDEAIKESAQGKEVIKEEPLIKSPVYLSNPEQILPDAIKAESLPKDTLNEPIKPMKRDLKSVNSDKQDKNDET